MPTRFVRRLVLAVSLALPLLAVAQPEPPNPAEPDYVRTRDANDGNNRQLQVAIRTFAPKEGDGPLVQLVGAVHLGDKAYYDELQKYLDAQAIVLYEGVKPEGAGKALPGDDAAKAKVTTQRQRILAIFVAKFRRENKRLPETMDEFITPLLGTSARLASGALTDGWGNPHHYTLTTDQAAGKTTFDIISYAADNAEGGEAAAADIRFTSQKPLTRAEVSAAGDGLQAKMARALGLEFQLTAIDYNRPNWRNSDLSIDEVQSRLDAKGAGDEMLFQMLDGSSMMAQVAGAFLGVIERNKEMGFLIKALMVETLAQADDIMKAQGGEMGALMEVILLDRNTAVLADLRRTLDTDKHAKEIALFYGAGHLPDLEKHLEADFNYSFKETRWLTAIDVDLTQIPGGKEQIEQMNQMIKTMTRPAGQ
ncbi:hypothetical protein PHYC_02751 [Phycisphaerales bacterium]|nr:hypothetical protein PHYC_02751 [Phycisphaerales bacterium]